MNHSNAPHTNTSTNPTPIHSIAVRLARIGFIGAVILFICLQLFGGTNVTAEISGESTIYTAQSSLDFIFYVFPVLTALLTIVYSLHQGIFRVFGVVLGGITAWLIYSAVTMDTSNHNVTLTSTTVSREVGIKLNPIRQSVDFTKIAYLYIDQVPGDRGPKYELVAHAATNGVETRIPIFDMMRAALPQIIECASKHNVVIGESVDGTVIPAPLRVDSGK